MPYQDRFYTTGAVTVQNGSAVVTGEGTGWETALIDGGVIFVGGGSYPIYSVESETSLTLASPFVGVSGAQLPYAIDRQRAAATSNIQMNDRLAQIIREISIGNIEQFNALTLEANKILHTNASKLLIQSDITAAALSLLNLTGTPVADRLPYLNGASGAALTPLTAVARNLLDDTTTAAQRATIGLNRPAFRAVLPADRPIGNGSSEITMTSAPLNVGNNWNGSRFLVPESGLYLFNWQAQLSNGQDNAGYAIPKIRLNGADASSAVQSKGWFWFNVQTNFLAMLSAGDAVTFGLELDGWAGNVNLQGVRTFANGVLIG